MKAIIRILKRGLADPLDFILRIMFLISGYVGGVSLKACIGTLNLVNHDGITNLSNGVVELNTRLKKFIQVCFVNVVFF